MPSLSKSTCSDHPCGHREIASLHAEGNKRDFTRQISMESTTKNTQIVTRL